MRTQAGRRDRSADAVTAGFFIAGIASVLLGPLIPELRERWAVGPSEVSSLFVAQFVASSIGAVVSSFHLRRSIVVGYGLVAVGLTWLAAGGWPQARPAMAVTGFGLGLAIPASNLWIAHRGTEGRGARLSTLNLIWGLGAVICPLLFVVVRGQLELGTSLGLLAAAAALTSVGLWWVVAPDKRASAEAQAREDSGGSPKLLFLGVMATLLFVYVGVENAIGGWLVTLADSILGERAVVSLLIGSGFWGALLAGRALAPLVLSYLSERLLFRVSLAVATLGTLLLMASGSKWAVAGGGLAAGLGLAPLFPLMVSLLAGATAATKSRSTGWVLACGGLGGAVLPWLSGQVTGASGATRHGFVVPLAGLIAMAALHGVQDALQTR